MSLTVVTDDRHRLHDPPFELNSGQRVAPAYERPGRLDAISGGLLDHPRVRPIPAVDHDDTALVDVHDPAMVSFLRDGYTRWRDAGGPEVMIADTFRSPRWAGGGRPTASPIGALGWWCFDTATPIVAGSFTAARAAVDVALTGVDELLSGSQLVFGLTRPPGHHAGHDYFGGFCFFNHAAVAARALTAAGRVAVLDIDVHHGNGTQDIFWRDPTVLYTSLHADPDHLYPFFSGFSDEVGEGPGRGATRNLPLPRGTSDAAYLTALTIACEVVADFDPAVVVVSLGFDTSVYDPIGSLRLTTAGYGEVARLLRGLGRPLLLLQEGGYAIDRLGDLAAAVAEGLTADR